VDFGTSSGTSANVTIRPNVILGRIYGMVSQLTVWRPKLSICYNYFRASTFMIRGGVYWRLEDHNMTLLRQGFVRLAAVLGALVPVREPVRRLQAARYGCGARGTGAYGT